MLSKSSVSKSTKIVTTPRIKPISPIRFTRKALIAAALAFLDHTNTQSKVGAQSNPFPTKKHLKKLGAVTRVSIKKVKRLK
jgi:hypothetical protein